MFNGKNYVITIQYEERGCLQIWIEIIIKIEKNFQYNLLLSYNYENYY